MNEYKRERDDYLACGNLGANAFWGEPLNIWNLKTGGISKDYKKSDETRCIPSMLAIHKQDHSLPGGGGEVLLTCSSSIASQGIPGSESWRWKAFMIEHVGTLNKSWRCKGPLFTFTPSRSSDFIDDGTFFTQTLFHSTQFAPKSYSFLREHALGTSCTRHFQPCVGDPFLVKCFPFEPCCHTVCPKRSAYVSIRAGRQRGWICSQIIPGDVTMQSAPSLGIPEWGLFLRLQAMFAKPHGKFLL